VRLLRRLGLTGDELPPGFHETIGQVGDDREPDGGVPVQHPGHLSLDSPTAGDGRQRPDGRGALGTTDRSELADQVTGAAQADRALSPSRGRRDHPRSAVEQGGPVLARQTSANTRRTRRSGSTWRRRGHAVMSRRAGH
jgi:hypothetical protein